MNQNELDRLQLKYDELAQKESNFDQMQTENDRLKRLYEKNPSMFHEGFSLENKKTPYSIFYRNY